MDFFTILHNDDVEELEEFLENHDIHKNINELSLLHWAVFMNNFIITKELLDKGANVNSLDKMHRTPLLIASFFGFYEIAKLLIENDAEVNDLIYSQALKGWDGGEQVDIICLLKSSYEK